jgi:hypothetical protein
MRVGGTRVGIDTVGHSEGVAVGVAGLAASTVAEAGGGEAVGSRVSVGAAVAVGRGVGVGWPGARVTASTGVASRSWTGNRVGVAAPVA